MEIRKDNAHSVIDDLKNYLVDEHKADRSEYNYMKKNTSTKAKKSTGTLEDFRNKIKNCKKCELCSTRTQFVFGEGDPRARLVFVGEAPGKDEDLQGRPFVGRAGKLLTKIIEAMGYKREEVYICNVLKCRPPNNRAPLPDEIKMCEPHLLAQLEIIKPKAICALGTHATKTLLKTDLTIGALRGAFHDYHGIKLMPTYHPAYLLRNPSEKRKVWEDVQKIIDILE
ncbi:MAG: uracil-DNA glycosylase [Candidatus Ancaeobacter aquaticus]|nr:uracil-DNA glycosylase [Candidatus Ancaeobacter aquaticus]